MWPPVDYVTYKIFYNMYKNPYKITYTKLVADSTDSIELATASCRLNFKPQSATGN